MKLKIPIIYIVLIILCLFTGFSFGLYIGPILEKQEKIIEINFEVTPAEKEIRVIEKPFPVIVKIPVEIPVEIPIEYEKIVEKPVQIDLRDFKNTGELSEWLQSLPEPVLAIYSSDYDCLDIAQEMIDNAAEDGYYMGLQIIEGPYYSPVSHKLIATMGEAHALNSVIIGNEYYFIEPLLKEYWTAYAIK